MAIRLPGPDDIAPVGVARDPGVSSSPDDFGAQVGRAMQQSGQQIQALAQIGEGLAKQRQGAEDRVFLDTFDLEYSRRANQTVLEAQTSAPLGGDGFARTVDQSLDSSTDVIAQQLMDERGFRPSPQALQAARSAAMNKRTNALVKAQTWEHNQRISALGGQFGETVEALEQEAFTSGDAEESLARLYESVNAYEGVIPADELRETRKEAEGRIVSKAIEGMISAGRTDDAEALTRKFFGGRPRAAVRSLPQDVQGRGMRVMSRLMGAGLTQVQAAGVVGNLVQESNIRSDGPAGDAGTAFGMAQWRGERFTRLKRFANARGVDWKDFDTQVDFIVTELKTNETKAWEALQKATTVDEATAAFISYERPAGWTPRNPRAGHGWSNRLNAALAIAGKDVADMPAGDPMMPNATGAMAAYNAIDAARSQRNAESRAMIDVASANAPVALENTGRYTGYMPSAQDFSDAFGPEAGPRRFNEFQSSIEVAGAAHTMKTMPTAQIQGILAANRPVSTGEDAALEMNRYNNLHAAAANTVQQRMQDPASYVMRHFPGVGQNFDSNPQIAGRQMLAMQDQLGIPRDSQRILNNDMVATIANQFKSQEAGGQNAALMMHQLAEQWGDLWPQVFSELSEELPAPVMVVGTMSRPDQMRASEELAEAVKDGAKVYTDNLPNEDVRDLREAIERVMPEFGETLSGLPGGQQTVDAVRESVELLALRYRTRGDSPSRAADRAYNDIIGKAWNFRDGYRVPKDINDYHISIGAREIKSRVAALNPDIPPNVTLLPDDDTQAAWNDVLVDSGYWVTTPDGKGLSLYAPDDAIVTMGGEPVVFTWDDILGFEDLEILQPTMPELDPISENLLETIRRLDEQLDPMMRD